jgi:preprotein translocase subunit SecG
MTTVLLIIHLLVAAALVAVVLMQRSEGGALGIGGAGGMMSARGSANLLTRTTMILGVVFMANSILLAVLSGVGQTTRSVVDQFGGQQSEDGLPFTFDDEAPAALPEAPAVPGEAPAAEEAVPEIPAEDTAPELPAEDEPTPEVPGR